MLFRSVSQSRYAGCLAYILFFSLSVERTSLPSSISFCTSAYVLLLLFAVVANACFPVTIFFLANSCGVRAVRCVSDISFFLERFVEVEDAMFVLGIS